MGGANGQIGTVAGASRLRQWVGPDDRLCQWEGLMDGLVPVGGPVDRDSGWDQTGKVGGAILLGQWAGPDWDRGRGKQIG